MGRLQCQVSTYDIITGGNLTPLWFYHLTDVQIQMVRELGMIPRKFRSLANHKQEKWKAPMADFIEELYNI